MLGSGRMNPRSTSSARALDPLPAAERPTFAGLRRPDGRVGTRNYVLVVPTSMCSSHEAAQIASLAELTLLGDGRYPNVDGVVALPHGRGCGCNDGSNIEVLLRTLSGYAGHPNVGGVIFVELGCEKTNLSVVERHLKHSGGLPWDKPVEWLGIQQCGGTQATVNRGLEVVEAMLPALNDVQRQECGPQDLILGVAGGEIDESSPLSADPATGHCADLVVRGGGTLLAPDLEDATVGQARDADVRQAIQEALAWRASHGELLGIRGTAQTSHARAGGMPIESVLGYSESPASPGRHLMISPANAREAMPGLVGAGANVVIYTTGSGTTLGNAIAPVIKLCSNTPVFKSMSGDIDLDAGSILSGEQTVAELGRQLFQQVAQVAGGVRTRAEEGGHREFQIWAEQAISL